MIRRPQRTVTGQAQRMGDRMEIERESLLGLAAKGFPPGEASRPTFGGAGCVNVRTSFYSTPLRRGMKTQAKVFTEMVEVALVL